MGLIDNIKMAFSSLAANKMRALLTMLGIIIGIASVIGIMTIGNSLSGSVTSELSSFGITNITVSVTQKSSSSSSSSNGIFVTGGGNFARDFSRSSMSESDLISDDMISEFRNLYSDDISAIVLTENVGNSSISRNDNTSQVSITGVNDEYTIANEVTMLTGRWINAEDNTKERKVCVISDTAAENLYGSVADAIGQSFTIDFNGYTREFYIEGVYQYDNSSTNMDLSNIPTDMYIPISTAKKINSSNSGYSSITVVASTSVDSTTFLNTTQQFFASYYTHNDSYTVEASNLASMLESMTSILNSLTLAISVIAGISLLVGGIGVMNIMLVSITERTREIGTRKALGATRNAIRMQFITESVIICLIGGIIGILLGLGIGSLGAKLLGFSSTPSMSSIIGSVLFSMGVGIFFGYYPANKAAKLNPIDALRYE